MLMSLTQLIMQVGFELGQQERLHFDLKMKFDSVEGLELRLLMKQESPQLERLSL